MSSYRESLDSGFWNGAKRSGFRKWAKRQMSKLRRRWTWDDVPPPTSKLTRGWFW